MESVFPKQPNVGELRQTAKLIDFVVNVDDFLVKFIPFRVYLCSALINRSNLFFEGGKLTCFSVSFAFLFVDFLCLFFLFGKLFLFLFDLPHLVFFLLLVLQQLILHFIVVSEEKHLAIDQGLEGMRLETHVNQKNDIVEEFIIALR